MLPEKYVVRFYSKINKTDTCWLWTNHLDKDGYGSMRVYKTRLQAHRLSYIIHKNNKIKNKLICHSCDNPTCVNPQHLFIGTHQDNVDDMFKKGRENKAKGFDLPQAKLSIDQAREIRAKWVPRKYTMKQLATEYGVSKGSIQKIIEHKVHKE